LAFSHSRALMHPVNVRFRCTARRARSFLRRPKTKFRHSLESVLAPSFTSVVTIASLTHTKLDKIELQESLYNTAEGISA
jgi:hypothetical protein